MSFLKYIRRFHCLSQRRTNYRETTEPGSRTRPWPAKEDYLRSWHSPKAVYSWFKGLCTRSVNGTLPCAGGGTLSAGVRLGQIGWMRDWAQNCCLVPGPYQSRPICCGNGLPCWGRSSPWRHCSILYTKAHEWQLQGRCQRRYHEGRWLLPSLLPVHQEDMLFLMGTYLRYKF